MDKGKGENQRASIAVSFVPFLFSLFLLSSCGTPGDPRPPRPTRPVEVTDLSARQMGARISLAFTLPERTTEGELLAAPPDVELYRGFAPRGSPAPLPQQLTLTIPSSLVETYMNERRVIFEDPVKPEDLAAHRDDVWVYAVRTRIAGAKPAHHSNASNIVVVRVLPAPPSPAGFAGRFTEKGMMLEWQPVPDAVTYRVFRTDAGARTETAVARVTAPVLLGATPATSFRDEQIELGRRYVYTVRSVAQVEDQSVESEPSQGLELQPEDVFAPATPTNVVIIATAATADSPAALDLSWSLSSEPDAAGYYVYRSEQEGTPGVRITQEMLFAPSFRDTSVTPGRRYFYAVTAVDRRGNESPRSAPVSEVVPERQP